MKGIAVLVATIAVFAGLTWQVGRSLEAPPDPLEAKVAGAKRFLYYVVEPERGPELRLSGKERVLHLMSHAVLPPGTYDPALQVVYGFRLSLDSGGDEVWRHDVYTRSRQSKAGAAGSRWLEENAFALDARVSVTDDRTIVVSFPTPPAAGTRLRVRLLGDPKEALLRVYAVAPRARAELALSRLSPAERDALASDLSFIPWDRLDPEERLARVRLREEPIAAEGEEGVDYRTRALYFSGFRLPAAENIAAPPLVVTPSRAAAVNVVGPGNVLVTLTRAARGSAATLTVTSVGEGDEPQAALDVPKETIAVTRTVPLAPGLHSLQLATDAAEGVVVSLAADGGAQPYFGALAPDVVALDAVVAEPGGDAVTAEIAGPDDVLSRIVRFDVRFVAEDAASTVPSVGAVSVDVLDDNDRLVARQTISLGTAVSPFEKAVLAGGVEASVTEPAGFRLIVPPGGKKVVVRTKTRALLRAFALLTLSPAPDLPVAPYRSATLVKTIWRYAPLDERSWIPLRLDAPPTRAARILAQVRLEASPLEIQADVPGQSLVPVGQPERQLVLERARAGERWQPGLYTLVTANRALAFNHRGGTAVLVYSVLGSPDVNLGEDVVAKVDGREAAVMRVAATRGEWTLPPLPAGSHTLSLETNAPTLRVLLDQPGAGERYALRNVYAVAAPLRVSVRKPGPAPLAVNIILYAPGRGADADWWFDVAVDGGAPRRREGVLLTQLTPSRKRVGLPVADRPPIVGFADAADRSAWHPRLVAVGLGDDLAPGPHTVTITQRKGGRTWARFFALGEAARPEQAYQLRLLESPDE